ncbi:MAG TPA: helix-turn-helix transcriptional regulator [Solirubrobacteraceae bacterium]|jgi:transcriptional regulator with XRE-family HTH domain|nr:helix-turn-helix transcriptional regulator [Solirubrobacteraceae bacterium]
MNAREQFAANLRAERQRLGLTQEALSERCDMNMSEVSRLERSMRDPLLGTIVKLAKALEVSPAELLDGVQ